jgi:hypothetical protein
MNRDLFTRGLAALTLTSALALVGCPGPEEVPPDASRPERDAATDAARVPDTGPSDAFSPDAFTPPDAFAFDAPGLDAFSPDAFTATPDAFDCVAPEGCFRCAPTTSDEFLDRCTTASCEPFVNDSTRLPLLRADGTLPPLP